MTGFVGQDWDKKTTGEEDAGTWQKVMVAGTWVTAVGRKEQWV